MNGAVAIAAPTPASSPLLGSRSGGSGDRGSLLRVGPSNAALLLLLLPCWLCLAAQS